MPKEQLPSTGNLLDARIYTIRGERVMLDSDLATVYEVETKALNRAVKRNESRFPERFAFQLTQNEWDALRCQSGTSNTGRGGRPAPPSAGKAAAACGRQSREGIGSPCVCGPGNGLVRDS